MDVAKQLADGDFDTVETDGDAGRLDGTLESGAYGELLRRVNKRALSFTFTWRGTLFKTMVLSDGEGMRLSLSSDLADIPYSVENAAARNELLAVGESFVDDHENRLTVVQGRTITLEHDVPLPDSKGDTMATLVTQLTMLVLNSAPYLDLIAESRAAPAGS